VSATDGWDELLGEARERLAQEEDNPNTELGDSSTPEPQQHFAGRWRGQGTMVTKGRGEIPVYLVWDRDDRPGFLYAHSRLVQEVEAEQPAVGDEVIVLRGPTRTFETKDGEERTIYPYILRKRACSKPLPAAIDERQDDGDAEVPF
jgi:hypothetical protein